MLPCKRGAGGESVLVEEENPGTTLLKKSRNLNSAGDEEEEEEEKKKETRVSAMALGDGNSHEIDEDLHSRQLAVYGRETMRRLFASNILVSGMQAKNLILAGVKSVTLHDEGNVELWDLSSNFIFSEDDVGKNRAVASVLKLQELNNAVLISALSTPLTTDQLSNFQETSQGVL